MDTRACTAFFSENFPLWAKLSQTERGLICKMTSEEFFSKGSNIHSGSNECTGAIFIKKGCLRAYILSEDGREITLYRLYKNDICMLSASCVLKSITFDVFVDAEEDSEVYIINGKTFADIAEKNSYVKIFALETAVKRFSSVMWIMQQILFMSLDRRIALFLCEEMEKTGNRTIKLTHAEIARYTGSAREAVSRMLKYFEEEKTVELFRGGITVSDPESLKLYAEG